MNIQPVFSCRSLAALLLQTAITDLFPAAHLLDSLVDELGFCVDFICPQITDEQLLPLQENVNREIRRDLPVVSMEMLRGNAIEFLFHKGQPALAEQLEEASTQTVVLAGVKEKFTECPEPHPKTTREIGVVALWEMERLPNEVLRIHGTALPTEKELRKYKKKRQEAVRFSHQKLGYQMGLFGELEEGFYWLPKGVLFKGILDKWLQSAYCNLGYQRVVTPNFTPLNLLGVKGVPKAIFEQKEKKESFPSQILPCGLFHSSSANYNLAVSVFKEEEVERVLYSSLQFIVQTVRIFGFQHCACFRVSCYKKQKQSQKTLWAKKILDFCQKNEDIEWQESSEMQVTGELFTLWLPDSLGRYWKCASLKIDFPLKEGGNLQNRELEDGNCPQAVTSLSVFGSTEQFIALLLEHYKGCLPFWLAPEQVRILLVGKELDEKGEMVLTLLKEGGFRVELDATEDPLGEKVHRFEEAKIPYAVIIGKSESVKGKVTVRKGQTGEVTKGVTIELLLKLLSEEAAKTNMQESEAKA